MKGYHGRFLKVNLSALQTEDMPLDEAVLKSFIGGATLAAKLLYDHLQPGRIPWRRQAPSSSPQGLHGLSSPGQSLCGLRHLSHDGLLG
jgi:hypothetical protein